MLNRDLVSSMYNQHWSFSDIAKEFGVSRQRIHQIITGYQSSANTFRWNLTPQRRKRRNVGSMVGYVERLKKNNCQICKKPSTQIHHKDGNSHNNKKVNLMAICNTCHAYIHKSSLRKYNRRFIWSKNFPNCIKCGTTTSRYGGYGMCSRCYRKI